MGSLSAEDLGSSAQRDRRRRILEATIALASRGGFEAVQMRTVAERADVALGTLYRYFPSKIHLLVSALSKQFDEAQAVANRRQAPGETPAERVEFVLLRATRALQKDPHLTEALTRAFMFADASVAGEIDAVGRQLTGMITRAMQGADYREGEEPTEREIAISRVIGDVWMSGLMAWVTGRFTAGEVGEHVTTAVRLLLR